MTAGATSGSTSVESGGSVNITSGSNAGGTVASSTGSVTVKAANAAGGSSAAGGSLTLAAGNSAAIGSARTAGSVTITAGNSGSNVNAGSNTPGGGVSIAAGSGNSNSNSSAGSAGDGGPISITSGNGGGGGDIADGGNITVQTGAAGGAGLAGAILFKIGGNFEKMRVNTDGTVGIGVTSPGARLDVTDASTTTSAIIVPRAGNFTGTTANGMIRYNTTSTLFEFYQNGAWVNYTTVSDGRLKTNVVSVRQGLDIVNQLNPVFYDWDQNNPKSQSFGPKHQVGFIAQEVEKVLPEVVNTGEDSYRSLEYGKIVSVVVAAVKELYNKVLSTEAHDADQDRTIASKADKTEVNQLKTEINQLKVENNKLKEENLEIKTYLCVKDPQASICK